MFTLGIAHATTNGATWSSATAGTLTLLTGGTSTIAVTGMTNTSVGTIDLSNTTNFCAALGTTTSLSRYSANNAWSATFSPAIPNLLLYVVSWRGTSSGASGSTTYTFTSGGNPINPTLVSGLTGAPVYGLPGGPNGSVAANTLTLGTTGFYFGLLRFPGTVSQLSVTTNATNSNLIQNLTFGVSDVSCGAPPAVSAPILTIEKHPATFATEVEVK